MPESALVEGKVGLSGDVVLPQLPYAATNHGAKHKRGLKALDKFTKRVRNVKTEATQTDAPTGIQCDEDRMKRAFLRMANNKARHTNFREHD